MPDYPAPITDTIDDFCSRFRIGRTTTYKLIKEGRLKVVKLGRRTLVPRAEADRLLAELLREAA